MSITSPQNNKGAKKGSKQPPKAAAGSKFIAKPSTASSFVKKKITTGSRRGG